MSNATFNDKLKESIRTKNSRLCVGLDNDVGNYLDRDLAYINDAIIDATRNYACAYKLNVATYLALEYGYDLLKHTVRHIQTTYETRDVPIIADVKFGDIGFAIDGYKNLLNRNMFDAITINPSMGIDSFRPFLDDKELGVFILCRPSNRSAGVMQDVWVVGGKVYYEYVADMAVNRWNYNNNVGLVMGGTYPEAIKNIRESYPDTLFLIPGMGEQGGKIEDIVPNAMIKGDKEGGFIINSSRQIMYSVIDDGKYGRRITTRLDNGERTSRLAKSIRDEINQSMDTVNNEVSENAECKRNYKHTN